MASSLHSKLFLKRLLKSREPIRFASLLLPSSPSPLVESSSIARAVYDGFCSSPPLLSRCLVSRPFFSSRPLREEEMPTPAPVDYKTMLSEEEFHQLADETIQNLLEKLEEYGDSLDMDGFDIDYGNQVLTLKLGDLGTYVINKQTPNRQIWLSSPVSGPSRFDWDTSASTWIYRRTKTNLMQLLQDELQELCGEPVDLSGF